MSKEHISYFGLEGIEVLEDYVKNTEALSIDANSDIVHIRQKEDGKKVTFPKTEITEVLMRTDPQNSPFIQMNFTDGKKLLVTTNLIGFKPVKNKFILNENIPNVVTTPDLINVFEALEETIRKGSNSRETLVLKHIYIAILEGGEAVGFDMSEERNWLNHIGLSTDKAS